MLVRDKALTQVLSEIDESTEIAVSVLCNREGFAIAYSINSEKAPDIDLLTPLAAVIHATANKAIEELHAGYHQTSIIESSKGTVLIRDIIDEIMRGMTRTNRRLIKMSPNIFVLTAADGA